MEKVSFFHPTFISANGFAFLPSNEVLVAVEHLGGALLDLLGDPVAQLVVPGLRAVAHANLQIRDGWVESNQVNRKRVDSLTHLCPLDGDAVAAARGQPHVLDGVRVQQVHAPPRRLLALRLGALKSDRNLKVQDRG